MKIKLFFAALALAYLTGCSGVNAALEVAHAVKSVRGATNAYYSFKMISNLNDPFPAFAGADVASFSFNISPRLGQDHEAIKNAMHAAVTEHARKVFQYTGLRVTACSASCPTGQRVDALFTETGFSDNIINRISVGKKLRGQLSYADANKGTMLSSQQVDTMENYGQFVILMNNYTSALAIETASKERNLSDKQIHSMVDNINKLDTLPKKYKKVLSQAT